MVERYDPARTGIQAGRVVGSLIGVACDWLDHPPVPVLVWLFDEERTDERGPLRLKDL